MPAIATKHTTNNTSQPESKVKWYSEDEVNDKLIDAYQKFKEGLKKDYQDKFDKNFSSAKDACESIFLTLTVDNKIRCRSVHLRFNSINSFEAIVVIPQKDYLSTSFDAAYHLSRVISAKYNKNNFEINFSFMPAGNPINTAKLFSEGFQLTLKRL